MKIFNLSLSPAELSHFSVTSCRITALRSLFWHKTLSPEHQIKKNKNIICFTRFSSHFEFWISWASVVQPWYNLATNWWGRLLCVNEQWLSSEVTQLSAAIECFFKQWDCRIYSDGINRFFIAWAGILGNKSASPTQTTSSRLIIWLALTFGCHQCWKCHLKSHG